MQTAAVVQQDKGNKLEKRNSLKRLIIATGVILVLVSILGLVGSLSYYWAENAGILSSWQALSVPPEKAVKIVTGDINTVFVRSVSNHIYGCKHEEKNDPDMCWYSASEPLDVDAETVYDNPLFGGTRKVPPSSIVDELDATLWYADFAFETHYVLDEDGIVWKWEYDKGGLDIFYCFLGPLAGAAVGILMAAVLWLYALFRRLKNNRRRMLTALTVKL